MPFDGNVPSSLRFRVSYDFWAYLQKSYDHYVRVTKKELSAEKFRQLAFELGVEKSHQKVSDEALLAANKRIRQRFKSITISLESVELNSKFQKFIYDSSGRVVEPIEAAVVFIYDGVKELVTPYVTKGDNMTGKNNPLLDHPGVLIEVEIMPRDEARETFRYNLPPPTKGREMTNQEWKSSMQHFLGDARGASTRVENDGPDLPKGREMASEGWNRSIQSALATLDQMIAKS